MQSLNENVRTRGYQPSLAFNYRTGLPYHYPESIKTLTINLETQLPFPENLNRFGFALTHTHKFC